MPSAAGLIKCDGSRIVGTFDVDGRPLYITVDIKPPNQPFECSHATLTYNNPAQLDGACKWTGTAGRDDIEMDFGGGVSITGVLATPRSSIRIRGAGAWSKVKSALPPIPANGVRAPVNPFPAHDALRDAAKVAREQQLIELGVPIIIVLGQTGTGKSTFINLIASQKQEVGKGLQSCTSEVSSLDASIRGQRVVIIDTPGIDSTRAGVKEIDVLTSIAKHLGIMGEHKFWVTGVLFMHRITDNTFLGTADRVSTMLKNLCGDAAMNHLILCTTMWDRVPEEEGYERFDELCETGPWKEMISKGAGTAMISNLSPNARAAAEKVVTQLIKNAEPVELAIQDEMVNQKLSVAGTSAGQVFNEHLQEVQAELERELKEMHDRLREESEANAARAHAKIRAREEDIARLDIQADEQAREWQAQADQLKREQERANREIKELCEKMRNVDEVNVAKVQGELLAREMEAMLLQQQAEELNGHQKVMANQFKQKRKIAVEAKKEAQKKAKEQAAVQAAKAKEETLEQQREINEIRKQIRNLVGANAAKVQKKPLARVKEVMKQADELKGSQKAKAKQLKSEGKSAEQAKEEPQRNTWRKAAAQAAKAKGGALALDPVMVQREKEPIDPKVPIVAIFGQSGVRKSSDEMANQRLTVDKTSAGKIFDAHQRGLQAETEREPKEPRDRLREDYEVNAAKRQNEKDEESANLQASVFISALLAAVRSTARIRGADSGSDHTASE